MSRRRAIHVQGLEHGTNPIPAASRRGPMLMTSNVFGRHPETGVRPAAVTDEISRLFDNLEMILRAGGSGLDAVLRIDVSLLNPDDRAVLNEQWEKRFPDPEDRPARHVEIRQLPAGFRAQLAAVAYDA